MKNFILKSGAIGFIVSITWIIIFKLSLFANVSFFAGADRFYLILLGIWPSYILFLGDPENKSFFIPVISIICNVFLYIFFGLFLWLTFYKNKFFILIPAFIILPYWLFVYLFY